MMLVVRKRSGHFTRNWAELPGILRLIRGTVAWPDNHHSRHITVNVGDMSVNDLDFGERNGY